MKRILLVTAVIALLLFQFRDRWLGLVPFNPGASISIKSHLLDSVAYGTSAPVDHSQNLKALGGLLEDHLRKQSRATTVAMTGSTDIDTKADGSEIAFADLSALLEATHIRPNDYSKVKVVAILAVDPMVFLVRSDSPYKSLTTALGDLGQKQPDERTGNMVTFVPFSVTAFADFHWTSATFDPVVARQGGVIRYSDLDQDGSAYHRVSRLSYVVKNRYPNLLIATLSQVRGVLGEDEGQLRALAVCDQHNVTVGSIEIPAASDMLFDCPLLPFTAIVINNSASARAEAFWAKELETLAKSPEWQTAIQKAGLEPRFISGKAADDFWRSQYEAAVKLDGPIPK